MSFGPYSNGLSQMTPEWKLLESKDEFLDMKRLQTGTGPLAWRCNVHCPALGHTLRYYVCASFSFNSSCPTWEFHAPEVVRCQHQKDHTPETAMTGCLLSLSWSKPHGERQRWVFIFGLLKSMINVRNGISFMMLSVHRILDWWKHFRDACLPCMQRA